MVLAAATFQQVPSHSVTSGQDDLIERESEKENCKTSSPSVILAGIAAA